jgi:ribose 5-phosphate isomerase A
VSEERSPAREAAATAAVELIEPGMAIGLGSGRALWRVVELIGERGLDVRAAVASDLTDERAREAGIEVVQLDGELVLDLAIDGADEVDPQLRLIKGGGGALLREKIVVAAAKRFVVVAETSKKAERLGEGFRLPVEIVRFAWEDTRRRLSGLVGDAQLREEDGEPFVTDEGHYIFDCELAESADPESLDTDLALVPGVVEHGLFIGMTEQALLGTPDGEVEVIEGS